jgi:hypothetical protein
MGESKAIPPEPDLTCHRCGKAMRLDDPTVRIEPTGHDDWVVYCQDCWQQEPEQRQ